MELPQIQPGKPMQNGHVERLNRTFREKLQDAYAFGDLDEVRDESMHWLYL